MAATARHGADTRGSLKTSVVQNTRSMMTWVERRATVTLAGTVLQLSAPQNLREFS
jgi:hypothetical protein